MSKGKVLQGEGHGEGGGRGRGREGGGRVEERLDELGVAGGGADGFVCMAKVREGGRQGGREERM